MAPTAIHFPPFQLDMRAWQLRRAGEAVPLRPKTLAVLGYLAERPGELVTKQALLDAIWPGIAVSEDVVRVSASELRAALGDDRFAPRFIETVPRLGYRFIGKTAGEATTASAAVLAATESPRPGPGDPPDLVVGRESERKEIAEWIARAVSGRRQLGFVTGEAGIGKTTLVDMALRKHEGPSGAALRVARGQCIEQYGGGEPYKPVLEAIAELRRGAGRRAVDEILRARAPGWVLDAVGAGTSRREESAGTAQAAAFEQSLHMIAAALAAIAAETPLVLVFEDVQWSDLSTLDLVSILAHAREPARLLVICTLRPADAIARSHPLTALKRELLRKGQCREILLGGLSAEEIASYLETRFAGAKLPEELLPLLVERSDGNPFFLVTLVEHLLEQRILVQTPRGVILRGSLESLRTMIPDGLRAVIEPRLERLSRDEQRVLEAASVAGMEFAAHAVTAVAPPDGDLGDVEVVEQLCDDLARRQEVLRQCGEAHWPDGTRSARYAFRHALYQQVFDQRLAPSRRRRLHQTIGEQLETVYGGRTQEIASVLAAHFEQSGDLERAVRHHADAAARARSRFAFQETRLHVEAALRLMRQQPETDAALSRQALLLGDLGWASFAHHGWGDAGAARAFAEMRELAEKLDASVERFQAMHGELVVHAMRAEYPTARQRGEEMLRLAEEAGYREALGAALPLAATYLALGDLDAAGELAERVRAFLDLNDPSLYPIASCQLLAVVYAHRGLVEKARVMSREAQALTARAEMPYLQAYGSDYTATLHVLLRDAASARPLAEQAIRVAEAAGLAVLPSVGRLCRAWCDVYEGRAEGAVAAAAAQAAFDEYVASGQRISMSALSLTVIHAHLIAGDVDRAREVLESAFAYVAETGEVSSEHELFRLKGECLLAGGAAGRAEAIACFERAIAVAASQGALLFELRATTSLHRAQPGCERLAALVGRFAPEDDCVDLREARALLEARGKS